jgi:hypothetical protein
MPKATAAASKDAALAYTTSNVTTLVVTSAEPANYAGVAAVTLGSTAFIGADVTLGAGGAAGSRRNTYAAKSGISVSASGTANHVCLTSGSVLLEVTTLSNPQAVTSGNTMNVASWTRDINEAT